jgi:HEAT repeat protein
MRKVIVLLDVDDTCAVSNSLYGQHNGGYRYNEALFQALKANNLTEVYLFTSYSLRAVAMNSKLEPETTPSRLKLINHLKQQGITVLGVLTNFDCQYQQGAGSYYEKVIKPYESLVLQGEDIRSEKHKKGYEAKCIEEEVFRKAGFEHKTDTKVSLYRYLLTQLKNSFFHSDYVFVIVDDSKGTMADLRTCHSTETPLLAILARPQLTMQNYQTEISDFLYKTQIQDLKTKIELLSKAGSNKTSNEKHLIEILKSLEQKRNEETLQSFIHQVEQFSCTVVESESKIAQDQAFSNLAPDSKKLQEEILSLAEPKGPEGTQAKVQGLGEPFYISIENARKILSQNEKGLVEKDNIYGNNPVSKVGDVYYKLNPEYFLTEQAVYQISLLLGGGILSPTRLLIIEIPGKESVPVQASLAVQGENLESILRLPGGIEGLKKKLGAERFHQDFPILLKELYLTDWLANKGYDLTMPWEAQLKLLTDRIFALRLRERPINFQDPNLTYELLEKKLLESRLKGAPILATLALMTRYPELSHGIDFGDLLHIPNLFKLLKILYPKDTPEQILQQVPELFHRFVPENISKHFILALLSEPADHKGDNFVVKVQHDANGKLKTLEIIGIDNDRAGIDNEFAMAGSIRARKLRSEARLHYDINVKSVFYGVEEFLNMALSTQFSKSPEEFITHWLGNMLEHVQCYLPLLTRGLYQAHHLHQQILINFAERFSVKLTKVQKMITEDREINHQKLFLEVEPILARYCDELRKDYADSQAFVLALYDEKNQHPLHKVLTERLQEKASDGKTIQEHLAQIVPLSPKFCDYEESFKQFILKNKLLKMPSQLQENILHFIMSCKDQIWLAQEPLVLTFEAFAKFHQRHKQAGLDLLKRFSKLNFITEPEIPAIALQDPTLLYRAMQNVRDRRLVESLIRGLLSLGAVKDKNTPDGSSLLHYAAVYCPAAIELLVEAGLEYSLKNIQGKTPLDLAIEAPNFLSMEILLTLGAGRYITLANGLAFIKYYGNKGDLARQLLSQNVELSWDLALQKASQEKETHEGVRIEGLGGRRYLTSELCKQVFKEGVTAGFRKENLNGRRNVTSTQINIGHHLSLGLHLKEKPELFGREIKVHYLAKHLFGFITPPVALWRFSKLEGYFWNKVPVGYPILASRSIAGNNLKEALEHHPDQLHNLDHESISEAILLALLINPEDGRADNYILEPITIGGKTKYRIVSIDNDRAFVSPLKIDKEGQDIEGSEGLQVKTILYCLDEMQMPLHPKVRERFLKRDPHQLLDTWLQDLEQAQKKIDALFNREERELLKEKEIYLDIEFKPSIVIDIYEKLLRIRTLLTKHPDSSGFTLLRHTIPNLSLRYIDAFSRYPTAIERFDALTPNCFDVEVVKGQSHVNMDIYVWPSSKVLLEQTHSVQGDAIVFMKEVVDNFAPLQAYFIRKGKWVTVVEKGKVVLRSVSVNFRMLANFAIKPNGLLDVNEKNNKELAALTEQVMKKMKFNKEQKFSKTKTGDFMLITKENRIKELKIASEKAETLQAVRESLKAVHQNLSNLKAIRDELQEGNVQKFRGLPSADQQEWIVNGKEGEFPGIDFARMKLPNNQPNIAKQEKVLKALAEIEFRTLRIQGCEVLTDRALSNVLRNSKGLYALSLIDCPKLTDAVISSIKKACPLLEKLELQGLNLLQMQESFPVLRVLGIKNCNRLTVWKGQYPNLERLELQSVNLSEIQQSFPKLKSLKIKSCQRLAVWEGQYLNLEALDLQNVNLPKIQQSFPKLKSLKIKSCERLTVWEAQYPNLEALELQSVNLSEIQQESFPKLKSLRINSCQKLMAWRSEVLNLDAFTIQECSLFKNQLFYTEYPFLLSLSQYSSQNVNEVNALMSTVLKERNIRVKFLSLEVKKNILNTLNEYWRTISKVDVELITKDLIKKFSDSNYEVRTAVAKALNSPSAHLSEDSINRMTEALLVASNDADWHVREAAVKALDSLSSRLPKELIKRVSEALLGGRLKDENRHVRCASANVLKSLTVQLPEVLVRSVSDALLMTQKDWHDDVRCNAVNTLVLLSAGLSEGPIKEFTEILLVTLKDDHWRVRECAANILTLLSVRLPERLVKWFSETLLVAIKNDDWRVKEGAAKILKALSARLPEELVKDVSEVLLLVLEDDHLYVRRAAANALGALNPRLSEESTKGVSEAWLATLKDWDDDVRHHAVNALNKLSVRLQDGSIKWFSEMLLGALKDYHWRVRQVAAQVLEQLSMRLSEGAIKALSEVLLEALKDNDWRVKKGAANVLGSISARLSEDLVKNVGEALLVALKDDNWYVKCAAADTLGILNARLLEGSVKGVSDALLVALKDEDLHVRCHAANALNRLSPRLPEGCVKGFSEVLLNALKNKDEEVRRAAENALDVLITQPSGLVKEMSEALLTSLKDEDWHVIRYAANALSRISARLSPESVKGFSEVLSAALKDKDEEVRRYAAKTLGSLSTQLLEGSIKGVSAALLVASNDKDQGVSRAAKDALDTLSRRLPEQSIKGFSEILLAALKDKDLDVMESTEIALFRLARRLPKGSVKVFSEILLTALNDKDEQVRCVVAEALGRIDTPLPEGIGVIDGLLAALKDEDGKVRRAVACALGWLSWKLPEGSIQRLSEFLLGMMKNENWHIRAGAANTLGLLRKKLSNELIKRVSDRLVAALNDEYEDVRRAVAEALGLLSNKLPDGLVKGVTETLLAALRDKSDEVKRAAAYALDMLSKSNTLQNGSVKGFCEVLLAALKDEDWHVRQAAVNHLGALSARLPEGMVKEVTETLLAALKDKDWHVRQAAANGLGALSVRLPEGMVKEVSEALLAALKDKDEDVIQAAANGLGALSRRLPEGVVKRVTETLPAALRDTNDKVKRAAVYVLDMLSKSKTLQDGSVKEFSEVLLVALKDTDWHVRKVAANGLGALSSRLPEGLVNGVGEALLAALKDENFWVRQAAAEALCPLSARLPEGLVHEALLAALKDENLWVRQAAAEALCPLSARLPEGLVQGVSEALLAALKDGYSSVRKAAANGLGALSSRLPEGMVKEVSEALLAALKDADWCVRQAAAKGLGALGTRLPEALVKGLSEALLVALRDGYSSMREAAANGLGALSARLPEGLVKGISEALLVALRDGYSSMREAAANALGLLSVRLSKGLFNKVSDILLASLKDRYVSATNENILGSFSAWLPEQSVKRFSEFLLEAVKNGNMKGSAKFALCMLSARLPERSVKNFSEVLLVALKNKDDEVRSAVERALETLSTRLSEGLVKRVNDGLLAALKDKSWDKRYIIRYVLTSISERLPNGSVKVMSDELLVALDDQDDEVREAATKALGSLSKRLPDGSVKMVSDKLLAVLDDEDDKVREAAAKALDSLSKRLPDGSVKMVGDKFLEMLKDKNEQTRAAVVNALGRLSAQLPDECVKMVSDELLAVLKGKNGQVRGAAAEALGLLSARLPEKSVREVGEVLLLSLKVHGLSYKEYAIPNILVSLNARLPEGSLKGVGEALLNIALKSDHWYVRETAAKALLNAQLLEQSIKKFSEVLLVVFKDYRWGEAVNALGELTPRLPGGSIKMFSEILLAALKYKDQEIRLVTSRSLIAPLPELSIKEFSEIFLAVLNDNNTYIRHAAANALGLLSAWLPESSIKVVSDALLAAVKDKNEDLRYAAANALGLLSVRLPESSIKVVSHALLVALEDKNQHKRVIKAAVMALGSLGVYLQEGLVKLVSETLLAALRDKDVNLRFAAANALGSLKLRLPEGFIKSITEALLRALNDRCPGVISAAAKALGSFSTRFSEELTKEVSDALLVALKNKEWDVRLAVINALGNVSAQLSEESVKELCNILLAVMNDKNQRESVIKAAAEALGSLGNRLPDQFVKMISETLLIELKDDKSDVVKEGAVKALCLLSVCLSEESVKEVIETLLAVLKDKNEQLRLATVNALGTLSVRLLGGSIKGVSEALLEVLNDTNWSVRAAASKALSVLSAQLSKEFVNKVSGALLVVLQDGYSNVRSAAAEALGSLSLWLPQDSFKRVYQALLTALEDNCADVREGAVKGIGFSRVCIPIEDLQLVFNWLLNASNDKAFDRGLDAVIQTLNYLMSNEYLNTVVGNSIRKSLSLPNAISVATYNNNIVETIKLHKEISVAMVDGNCAMDAVALGICDLILQNKDSLANNQIKSVLNTLNPFLLKKTGLNLLAWLEKETDRDKRQVILASILRELAVEYVGSHVRYYKESYETELLAAFEQYKLGLLDDTFSVHPHIRKKFEELSALINIQNQDSNIKETKESQETKQLLDWWNKGVGKNPSGFMEYLSNLKLSAQGVGGKERWCHKIEIGALAFCLEITVKYIKPGIEVSQEQLLGMGYGCVLGLSEPEIDHLVNLGVGSRFQGNFRIEIADVQELAQRLQLETLTEEEKAYLDKNGQETILAFIGNIRNCPVPERAGMQELCDKLKRIGLFIESKNQPLCFVSDTVLNARLTPVSEALKKKVLAAHIQPLCFVIERVGVNWSYRKDLVDTVNKKIQGFSSATSDFNSRKQEQQDERNNSIGTVTSDKKMADEKESYQNSNINDTKDLKESNILILQASNKQSKSNSAVADNYSVSSTTHFPYSCASSTSSNSSIYLSKPDIVHSASAVPVLEGAVKNQDGPTINSEGVSVYPLIFSNSQSRPPEGLFDNLGERKQSIEVDKLANCKISEHLVKVGYELGKAVGKGDCFFDAIGQELLRKNVVIPPEYQGQFVYKKLRKLCEKYAKTHQREDTHWLKRQFTKGSNEYQNYLIAIAYTAPEAEDMWNKKLLPSAAALWGRPEIDGRIICEVLNVKLHIIELMVIETQIVLGHNLIDANGSKQLTDEKEISQIYNDNRVIHLAGYQYAYHWVPVSSKLLKIKNNLISDGLGMKEEACSHRHHNFAQTSASSNTAKLPQSGYESWDIKDAKDRKDFKESRVLAEENHNQSISNSAVVDNRSASLAMHFSYSSASSSSSSSSSHSNNFNTASSASILPTSESMPSVNRNSVLSVTDNKKDEKRSLGH